MILNQLPQAFKQSEGLNQTRLTPKKAPKVKKGRHVCRLRHAARASIHP